MSQQGQEAGRLEFTVRGAVQGVGFRPFVYRLAHSLGLAGEVSNTAQGVAITVEGPRPALEAFRRQLEEEAPPLSMIASIHALWARPAGLQGFVIDRSAATGGKVAYILPDLATCPDCLQDIREPDNRRYGYPFTNCTHCGPRFTIIRRLPYDRPNTTMAGFTLCDACRAEYENPGDRRFHAQPTACPKCGPHLELWTPDGAVQAAHADALEQTAEVLRAGAVVAVKGLGGFHLLCDSRDPEVVARLRARKHREEKPFALMYPTLADTAPDCCVGAVEARLLASAEAPIVLLARQDGGHIAPNVAPEAPRLGVMLPYTPLHHLLLAKLRFPVVATSGNLREEPICTDEHEALTRLAGMADAFLVHNRPIVRAVDDSVVQVVGGQAQVMRRARGYAPLPVRVGEAGPPLLATGAHHKNTVALGKDGAVFLSQHVGDLETPLALDAHAAAADALATLYDATPEHVACDLHPDYASTARAQMTGLPCHAVQHHFAHVLACMAEHGLDEPVLGVAWDGSGYGTDGTVWGGEFLAATRGGYQRIARLRPFRLPGGEQAVREPRRAALGLLYERCGIKALSLNLPSIAAFSATEKRILVQMLERGFNAPRTSSVGRLFDAAASILGLRQRASYEGQAAMALEHAAHATAMAMSPCPMMRLDTTTNPATLDWAPLVDALLDHIGAGAPLHAMAAAFHASLVHGILSVAHYAQVPAVVLTGGCFQNVLLSQWTAGALERAGLRVYQHRRIPPNDGAVALGQAVHAWRMLRTETTAQR